jgi:hypothetical protein
MFVGLLAAPRLTEPGGSERGNGIQ